MPEPSTSHREAWTCPDCGKSGFPDSPPMVRCGKPSPSLREQVAYVQSLKDSLAKMIEWARHPSPIPYIPFRADVDDAERLLKGPPCICPSHASNRGESDWDGIEDYRAAVLAAIKSDEEWSA